MAQKRKRGTGLHECDVCAHKSSRVDSLRRHELRCERDPDPPAAASPERYECAECLLTFSSAQRLESHKASSTACPKVHIPEALVCDECGKTWPQKQHVAWRRHREQGHSQNTVVCPLCDHAVSFEGDAANQVCADSVEQATHLS